MLKSYNFPSAYEATNNEYSDVADNLLNGTKIKFNDNDYIVGNLAMVEGYAPHKTINASPTDVEYKLLAQSGLLLVNAKEGDGINLTCGFPYSTYNLYKDKAVEVLLGDHSINVDTSTFGGAGMVKKNITVSNVNVIPEIQACVTAIREGETSERGGFFMVSVGFGTCEAVVSLRSGLVQRSIVSTHGIRHAVNLFANELSKQYYLNLKTEHQLDSVFQQGRITINREKHDVTDLRKKVLKMYYENVISPALKAAFTDDDFNKCPKMYLAGGGIMYAELLDCFKAEFGDYLDIEVYSEPEKCASQGYCLYSKGKTKAKNVDEFASMDAESFMSSSSPIYVGLDLGNANTCVTLYSENE